MLFNNVRYNLKVHKAVDTSSSKKRSSQIKYICKKIASFDFLTGFSSVILENLLPYFVISDKIVIG